MEHIDAPLFQTLSTLPAFPFARMVRPDVIGTRAAQQAFFRQRAVPSFTFSRANRFDAVQYLRELDAVADRIESLPARDIVRALYREKIEELRIRCQLIQAIQRSDDDAVSSLADHLFGTPTLTAAMLKDECNDIQSRAHKLRTHKNRIDTKLLTKMVQKTLAHYNIQHYTIRETNRSSVSIMHGNQDRGLVINIPRTLHISCARAARLLTHEIEVHVLRAHNGRTSPMLLLGRGLANYITADEGLAMALQQSLRTEESTPPGFWDAWAAALTIEYGFSDAFDALVESRTKLNIALERTDAIPEAQVSAWRLMLRAMRGIHQPGRIGLGYRRDHIYRTGLMTIQNIFDTHGKAAILPILFAGHAGTQHIHVLQMLGITGKTPDMIGTRVVRDVLRTA